jgi:general stress protein 26
MENQIQQYLKNLPVKLCVMATVTENGQPECAVLAYVVHDDLSLTISTNKKTRKWHNISKNNKVSLTFGWDHNALNVQYEGIATLVPEGLEQDKAGEVFFEVHPYLKQYQGPDTGFVQIKPHWVRTTDLSVHPPKVEEKTL